MTQDQVDLAWLNKNFQLESFNNLCVPGEEEESPNCFQLVSYHMESPGAPRQVVDSLFSLHPCRDYLVLLLPRSGGHTGPLAPLVTRASPRPGCQPSTELFLLHKASLRGGVAINLALSRHVPGIESLAAQSPQPGLLLQDVHHALETEGTDARALVLLLHSQVVGVAVVRTEWEADYLATHYTSELGDRPVRLHHLLLAPVFQRFARHFLAQLLRLTGHSSLTRPVYRASSRARELHRYSPLSVLDELQMAAPRPTLLIPSLPTKGPPPQPAKILPPFSLFHLPLSSALLPLLQDTRRIVVVGTGPAALACAEVLATSSRYSRPNLSLVTRDEVEQDYGPSVLNMAPALWGRGGGGRAARLSLRSLVTLVPGQLAWVNRTGGRLGVEGREGQQTGGRLGVEGREGREGQQTVLLYDRLVLCVERDHYLLGLARLDREGAANYVVPDCLQEAARCLRWVRGCCSEATKQEGYIIVLGLTLHSLAVVNSLLEAGASPGSVLLVKTQECGAGPTREPWHEDGGVRNKVLNTLRLLGVRVKAYSLVDCRRDKARGTVEAVIFSKGEELVEAGCLLLVNCTHPCVAPGVAR